jgi:hypothetical protein
MISSLKTSDTKAERLRGRLPRFPVAFGSVARRDGNFFAPSAFSSGDGPSANSGADMPYTRPIRRFYLTPPSIPIFVASIILALLAVLAVYGKMSIFNASYAFLVLLIAYVVLLAGNIFRGV